MYCTRNICAICLLLMVYNWTPGWICPPVQISGHLALICEDNIIAYVHSYPQENGGTRRPKLLLLLCPLVLPRHVPTWTHTVPSRVGFVMKSNSGTCLWFLHAWPNSSCLPRKENKARRTSPLLFSSALSRADRLQLNHIFARSDSAHSTMLYSFTSSKKVAFLIR